MPPSSIDKTNELRKIFRRQFACDPEIIVRAPGRVNLIGEHTDYNGGFVLPAAIDREVMIAANRKSSDRKSSDTKVELYSMEYDEFDSFSTEKVEFSQERAWSNYLRGVVAVLQNAFGKIRGFRAVVSGNVPQGAGLSSSAALEVATCTLLNQLEGFKLDGKSIALQAQKAENEFVGVRCGIMDQFVSSLAEKDAALLIDCRDLSFASIPLRLEPHSLALAITHTGVTRGLVSSKYNERRSECEEGLSILSKCQDSSEQEILTLRDLSDDVLKRETEKLPPDIAKRVRHVVSENERVRQATEFLRQGDLSSFGKLMIQSHESLRDDYEVSCKELDTLVALTLKHGALGARMTGAGFGGCTVALIKRSDLPGFSEQVLPEYERRTGCKPTLYVCETAPGASVIE